MGEALHESTIAKRYANALAELAAEQDVLAPVGQGLQSFMDLLQATPDLRALLTNPVTRADQQHAVVETFISQAKPHATVANFLRLLLNKRRMILIDGIVTAFQRNVAERSGRIAVEVRTAQTLSQTQQQQLKDILSQRTGKDVSLDIREETGLLGGIVVRIGSVMMDYSLRNRLLRLKAYMMG
ncbi:MAG: ATP synthase F1 subunit delta [Magnetococcales bacterium]|nr:ATP synthase F1 subunit delta [Magnetococcales bacterium]